MANLSLQLRTICGACGKPVPVNAVVPGVLCAGCGAPASLSLDAWKRVVAAARMGLEAGMQMGATAGDRKFQVACEAVPPRCGGCERELPMEQAAAYAKRGFIHCPGCGTRIAVRPVPPQLESVLPMGTTHLVAEDQAQLGSKASTATGRFFLWSDLG